MNMLKEMRWPKYMGKNGTTEVGNFHVIGRDVPDAYVADKIDADLYILAPDHALLLAAMMQGKGRCLQELQGDRNGQWCWMWTADQRLVDIPGIDPFGAPLLTPELRAELRKSLGLATDSLST